MIKNWRRTVEDLFTDKEGNYKMGTENMVTTDDLIEAMGLEKECDKQKAEGLLLYRRAQVEMCAFMTRLCNDGYAAGGINREPTQYFIAKNKSERRMLVGKYAKGINGRLRMLKVRGKNLLSERKIPMVIKELEYFEPVTEQN